MPKRISITLLFTLMFATVALFAATDVRAFSDFCDTPVETLTNGNWQITLVDVSAIGDSGQPFQGSTSGNTLEVL